MAVGKITGQMLGDSLGNLDRDGVDLAFDTDLIYLDVVNRRVGIKTTAPTHELTVNGTTRTTTLEVTSSYANIGDIVISGNNIYSTTGVLNLSSPTGQHILYQNKLIVNDIQIEGNHIRTINSNASLDLSANGTGVINLNGNVEVFGNLHATGTITADGNLSLGDADTDNIIFNAEIASSIIPDVDNIYQLGTSAKRWKDIWVGTLQADSINTGAFDLNGIDIALEPGNTIYVSENGSSSNTGTHPQDPVDSIGRALDIATAGDTVYIYPGTYSETLPLIVPAGVTVKGTGLRSVTVQPTSDDTVDMFLLNGETTIEDLTLTGFKFDSGSNTGYAFKFAPGMTVTSRSPYIRNVTVITQGSVTSVNDPRGFLTGDAGKGAYLDGSVVNVSSKEAACLFHSVTFICPGVDTLTCTNGVRVEWLNSFTYFADRSIYAVSGILGFASDGKTRVKIVNKTGTFNVGNTLSYYDVNGITVLASGTIESIDGNFYVIDGKALGFESLVDRDPKTVFANGNASLSTAQKKYGTASLALDGTGDYVVLTNQADFGFGSSNFTMECWVYKNTASQMVLFDARTSSTAQFSVYVESNAAGNLRLFVNGSYVLTSSNSVPTGSWAHVALCKASGTTRFFINGVVSTNIYADSNNYGTSKPLTIGANFAGSTGWNGYIDDVRICKGAAKYTGTFTAPTSALKGDKSTVLLLHFDGPNGSTSFLDDGVTLQDVRTSAGGTASIIDFVDYSDFGAEIRSIASASVYGNYGIYGDGDGVIGYFVSHNMGYIGSGRLSNNDPTFIPDDSTNVNEVVEINRAQIYFTSVDNKGDFRVGEFFYVNQRDGTVTFNESDFTITSSTGITFTDGSNITELTPTYIQTGNIKISGNTIESIVNGITLTAANSQITATSNVTVTGTFTVDNNFTVNGNTVIGDTNADLVTFNAEVVSNFVPDLNTTFNLGSSTNQWNKVFLAEAIIDDIRISGNLISTTVSNSNLELRANGSGSIRVDLLDFKNNTISSNTTNTNINITPNGSGTIQLQKDTYITGNLSVSGNITLGGNITIGDQSSDIINVVGSITNNLIPAINASYNIGSDSLRWRNLYASKLIVDDIEIDTNVIRSTLSNQNLELRANGTGAIRIDNLDFKNNTIISNTTNTDIQITPNGIGIIQLQKDTNITGTLTVSNNTNLNGNTVLGDASTDTVNFIARINSDFVPNITGLYNLGSDSLRWRTLFSNRTIIDDIEIDTNVIRSTLSNQNLELRANGTGSIRIDTLDFKNNTIISNTTNTDIVINPNGTGSIQLQKPTIVTGSLTVSSNASIFGNTVLGDNSADSVNFIARITSNINPATNSLYNLGSDSLRWRSLYTGKAIIDNIEIDTNYIQTTISNQDLELRANGTGAIRIDNLDFKNNTIISNTTNTDIVINPNGTGTIQLQKDTYVTGNFTVSANTQFNGNIIVGDASTDTVNFIARINSDFVPNITGLYNLGSDSLRWRNLYASKIIVDNIEIDTNYIQTTISNQDLELRANGTGSIRIDNLDFKNNTIISNSTNTDIQITPNGTGTIQLQKDTYVTGNFTVSANTQLNGNTILGDSATDTINFIARINSDFVPLYNSTYNLGADSLRWRTVYGGKLILDNIEIDTNYIQTTVSNQDLELRANGTGAIRIDNLDFKNNTIISNTSNTNIIINPNGTGTIQLQKDTFITGNFTVSANTQLNGNTVLGDSATDTINFIARINSDFNPSATATYNLGADSLRWRTVYSGKLLVDNIEIDTNYIQTTISNQDLELRANGTGAIRIDSLDFKNNTIISNSTNTDIVINPNGTGTIQLQKDTFVTGNFTVSSNTQLNGNTILGDSATDTINFIARINSDFLPLTNSTYNLGADTLRWRSLYSSKTVIDNIEIDTNIIQTTISNQDLELRANGTGAIRIDSLDFKNNTIISNSTNTDIQINPNGTGTIQLQKDTYITGNLDVTGNISLGGNITIGDQSSDTINLVGSLNNSLIPSITSVYNIGSDSLRWRNLYASKAIIDDIEIDTNVIRSTLSNQNLELRANGTGSIRIDLLDFKNNSITSYVTNSDIGIRPNGTGTIQLQKDTYVTGNLDVTGNLTLGGNITIGNQESDTINVVGSITNNLVPAVTASYDIGKDLFRWRNIYSSKILIDDIEIDSNLIRTTNTNADLELRANGTGAIRIDNLDFNDNVISTNTTDTNIIINPNGTGSIQLQKDTVINGSVTVTGTSSFLGSLSFGDSLSDTISFNGSVNTDINPNLNSVYNLGSNTLRWNNVYASRLLVDSLVIDTNVIQLTESNANLELRANGTGSIRIDNLDIKNNTITSNTTNTDIQITPNGTGTIQLQKDTYVTGNLDVTGNITLGGNINIGNQTSDTINVIGSISNNLIPSGAGLYDIGSSVFTWRNLYASNLRVNDVEINDNYITTTLSNADLELSANGSGVVRITSSNFIANQNVTVSGTSTLNNLTVTGSFNASSITVNNTLTASTFATGDIEINGNVIRTINSNSNLELRAAGGGSVYAENLSIQQSTISGLVSGQDIELTPSGTGIVKINSTQSLQLPVGTDAQRPGTPAAGMVRFNSTVNQYEGYNGSYWIQLGGVSSVDRKTYIKAEASPGTNDNTIYFYANNSLAATLTGTDFRPNALRVDDLEINGNVIRTTTTNTDIELRPNGTGAVNIDGFKFSTNTLLNTNVDAVTEFRSTGNGYYRIVGSNAVVIPSGNNTERPTVALTGMIRYNTVLGFVEVYDGVTWANIAGASSGITLAQAEDIALVSALIFG